MNMVSCGEDCRYQIDGCCTRSDLIVNDIGKPVRHGRSELSLTAENAGAVCGGYTGISVSANRPDSSNCCYFERR